MFERLRATYPTVAAVDSPRALSDGHPVLRALFRNFGGCEIQGGLYRIHTVESAALADMYVADAFPDFSDSYTAFGFDWLGRQFCLDLSNGAESDPTVLMFEPGTGEVLKIPVAFSRFHDEELVNFPEEALALSFFDKWSQQDGRHLKFSECVGYRVPLFCPGGTSWTIWKSPT